ncbi:penicillin amidase [Micromonospora nigra]|uniref:Penicillin amidase n=1 Tax=Micromonospora nigra TaxID=145857 RepID=A0A1C6RC25_9ACTN|nr:penicillin acylase family protein [Micromonospora nigra]SCL14627.1 penicillin amidase [Micromonospora nigra]
MTRPRVVRRGGAEIRYDRSDRPRITAGTVEAATFGLGWSVAHHRREQMDLLCRRVHGRLAEVAGPVALPGDRWQRRLHLAEVARQCFALLPAGQRELVEAFTAGVNDATGDATGHRRWSPVDSIAVAQLLFQELASDGSELRMVEVMRRTLPAQVVDFLLPEQDEFETDVDGARPAPLRPTPPLALLRELIGQAEPRDGQPLVVTDQRPVGSNAWAASHAGSAVLASDTHLSLTNPSLWYAATIALPDTTVTGVTIPGLPVIVSGTNQHVAWGFTRLPGDVVDLCDAGPAGPGDASPGGAGAAGGPGTPRRETIAVRGGPDEVLEVRDSPSGPIVGELAGRAVAFRSTLTDPRALDFGLLGMYGVTTVADGVAVLTDSGLPPVNAVLADRDGGVAWTVGGRFPARAQRGPRGFSPPGESVEWIPAQRLPRVVDPASGFVVSCNNSTTAARSAGVAWNFFGGHRARRVAERLRAGDRAAESVSARLQLDVRAELYTYYRDLALRHLPAGDAPEPLPTLRDEISRWAGTADRDEYGLAVLVVFRDLLREELFAALTAPCRRYDPEFTYCYHGHESALRGLLDALPEGLVPPPWRTPRRFVVGQLLLARAVVAGRVGHERPARWGEVNLLARSPLGRAAAPDPLVELSGCAETVCVAQPDFGAAMRLVVDPARPERGLLTLPGSPTGTGRQDQAAVVRWATGATDPLLGGRNRRPAGPGHPAGSPGARPGLLRRLGALLGRGGPGQALLGRRGGRT